MTGNWSAMQMQMVVRGFLAYQLTDSYAALGVVELATSIPRLLFAMSGGVVADRASRRLVMQGGQLFNVFLASILATLLFADILRFEHLLIAALIQGIANSFTMPARQALIPEIVGPDRLTNAYGLNVFSMNVTRLAAPALAGVLIAVIGAGWVYALMAFMYLFAVISMFKVPKVRANRASRLPVTDRDGNIVAVRRGRLEQIGVRDIQEAFAYLKTQRVLWILLLVHMGLTVLAMPYQRLLPGFVDDVLSNSEDETAVRMGMLLALTAVGALIGSLTIASLPNRNRGAIFVGSMVVFGMALLAFSISEVLWVSAGLVIILGIGQSGRQSLNNILIQTHVSDEYRGRISSIMLLENGVDSLGIFGIALLAGIFGVQVALAGTAIGMLVLAVVLWFGTTTYRRLQ
jgi:MFS family permease